MQLKPVKMEIKDIHEIKNNVFDRKELTAKIISEIAPSNIDVISHLAKKLNLPEEAIKIRGIYGEFGSKEFKVKANIYPSKEHRNKIERKTKKEVEKEKAEVEAVREAKKAAKENKE
jgi:ribosomal protein S24E